MGNLKKKVPESRDQYTELSVTKRVSIFNISFQHIKLLVVLLSWNICFFFLFKKLISLLNIFYLMIFRSSTYFTSSNFFG